MSPEGVFDVLDTALADDPGAPAVVARSGTLTYAELDAAADRSAGALCGLGVRAGERVAACLPNDLDIVAAFHGVMRLGALWVGVSRLLAPPEMGHLLGHCGPAVVLADAEAASKLASVDHPGRVVALDWWRQAVAAAEPRPPARRPDPRVPAAIAYTSGTTGFPKGAVHSQAGLVLPGAATVARRRWGPGLRKGDHLPLTILNMMVLTTLLTAQARATAVIMDEGDSASVCGWIRRHRVTVWNGPPALLHTLASDPAASAQDLASLEEVWVGGGDCSDALRRRFEAKFGVPVVRTYGLTEAPALVALDDRDGRRPPGTSGRPLDHLRVDSAGGELVVSGVGEGAWAGCYQPMLGYWDDPGATAAALAGGVLHTGDLGEVEDGHVRVIGRLKEVIVRGGANVYPAEVERVLAGAPGVRACAVVGVPDERLGERVGAVVEGPADPQAVIAHCRRQLAAYKVPERIVLVQALPRNQMGKVTRPRLAELFAEGYRG